MVTSLTTQVLGVLTPDFGEWGLKPLHPVGESRLRAIEPLHPVLTDNLGA